MEPRSDAEILRLKSERGGGRWAAIRAIHRRRPLLTAVVVAVALVHSLVTQATPADLVRGIDDWRFWAAWTLMIVGVGVRLWGAGNLRKNEEITEAGVFSLIRHPLYFGSLAIFLAYFLTVGSPAFGILCFIVLVVGIYRPTMLAEEEHLQLKFPRQFAAYAPPPRFFPHPGRLDAALSSDRFTFAAAMNNLGVRSFWVFVALPALLEIVRQLPGR